MKIIILVCLISVSANAQWQQDVRLTNAPGYSGGFQWKSSTSGKIVHIVFDDSRDGNFEIYYKRSTDEGISWEPETRLTNDPYRSEHPAVTVSGSIVHVVWQYSDAQFPWGNVEIYYKRSTDGGISWEDNIQLTNDPESAGGACIAVSGTVVHVAWVEFRDGLSEIYYKRSTDGGVNWSADIRLTNDPAQSYDPAIVLVGSVVHIAWYDNRDGNFEIYYKRSTDEGISWGADGRLTHALGVSCNHTIAASGSVLHIMWVDERDTNAEIYYKRSEDEGINLGDDIRLTNDTGISNRPNVALSGLNIRMDFRSLNDEIYYRNSTDGGMNWEKYTQLTTDPSASWLPSVSLSGSIVHVVWEDYRDGNFEIYYKRNPTGNPIGIAPINLEVPGTFSLSQNYPNPFNPSTKIQFALPKNSFAKLVVYDALGRELETIVSEQLNAGTYEADWNADKFSSGVYYYKLTAGDYTETKKMVLMK